MSVGGGGEHTHTPPTEGMFGVIGVYRLASHRPVFRLSEMITCGMVFVLLCLYTYTDFYCLQFCVLCVFGIEKNIHI